MKAKVPKAGPSQETYNLTGKIGGKNRFLGRVNAVSSGNSVGWETEAAQAASGDAGSGVGAKVRQRVSPGHRGKGTPGLGACWAKARPWEDACLGMGVTLAGQ